MARYVCVYVPHFPSQTLVRLRPELQAGPTAVLDGDRPFEKICSFNPAAVVLGIQAGMSRAEAESFPVQLLRRSVLEERNTRSALLSCLANFSPALEDFSENADCIYILDLKGMERLHGSVAAAMLRMRSKIRELGLEPRLVSSANLHAALCLARSGKASLAHLPAGTETDRLSSLLIHVLDLSEDHARTLAQWGIKTLGDLGQLPEVELIARFGQQAQRLRMLAMGKAPHHFQPIAAPFALEEFFEFDSPVEELDSLLFVINSMLVQLVARASAYALALASVTMVCTLEGAPSHSRRIQPSLPSVDRAVFLKLFQLDLEAHPPIAGVLSLRLMADPGQTSKVQLGLFSPQLPEPMRLEVTLARLAAVVGEDRVGKAVLKDTHQHDSFNMHKFTIQAAKHLPRTDIQQAPALRRLRPCVALKVDLRHGEIRSFSYERLRYKVQRLYGPWRFSGEWWTGLCWAVERWDFVAQCGDTLLLGVILQNHVDRSWWLEALYD